ncbi:alpha/beta hydrolase [Streptomyces aidingensis]|uniref:Carboxylesterase n=1 Tax=Streptomyces aidingensis TaxID=910347 RepID=A0A1I1LGX3_9ACTN|nr:alpha/beta fold hydrolase [Streptomyces aidingensis]SFC72437.1 carboxylesterase [Streptomyces aidingensis]
MTLLPGAEPYTHRGSADTGVLLCHGFTGTPQSLRPWAEHLAAAGHTVSLPLLPGHGTRWQDLQYTRWQDWYAAVDRELHALAARCAEVYVCGLSMGGALALRLAARHAELVKGVAVVNPVVGMARGQRVLLPVARHLVPSTKGIVSDIAKPGTAESGYTRVPLHAAHSLARLVRVVYRELPGVTQPLLLMTSRNDHVVPPANSGLVRRLVSSADLTAIVLEQSYHVATLDHDAERIFQETDAFISRITRMATRKTLRDGA